MKPELQSMITDCTAQLNDINNKMASLQPFDKTRSYLTQYALMKTCGTLEYVYRSIVVDFFDQLPLPQIHTYLDITVRSGSMSATYDNMNNLLGKFDSAWKNKFKNAVQSRPDAQKIIGSTKSLVINRHLFAHGQSPTATFNDIYQYYQDALILINEFDAAVV